MSGTRLPSKTARATDRPLLLIAAHGERGGARDNARLAAIAEAAAALLPDWEVRPGVLSGEPSIESALTDARGRAVYVWPFFMCRGYFTDTALAGILSRMVPHHVMLREFGGDPAATGLAIRAMERLSTAGQRPSVLVVAHGSRKSAHSRNACEAFAARLCATAGIASANCAYLEEAPFAAPAIAALPAGSVVISLFAGDGLHGRADMRAILAATARDDLHVICPATDLDGVSMIAARAASFRIEEQKNSCWSTNTGEFGAAGFDRLYRGSAEVHP